MYIFIFFFVLPNSVELYFVDQYTFDQNRYILETYLLIYRVEFPCFPSVQGYMSAGN